ncbi:hypothetical protein SAMN04488540_113112 [Ferrimonas sediminum]|uniref:Uncharacterized protein n=1 Tax=Ferrimonas sediminum TaxID=718193 RepID=A0A1G8WMC4_9GAMM|nr:hypothetical protein [Ferrimonas sediminum]SDJ79512.1 hypothetical protein SAMN04488540_113112 [Ferrimonas sediminum]
MNSAYVWGAYALLLPVYALAHTLHRLDFDGGGFGANLGPLVFSLLIVVAQVASHYRRPIGWRWLWQAVMVLFVLYELFLCLLAAFLFLYSDPQAHLASVTTLVSALVLLPGGWVITRYALRSRRIWQALEGEAILFGR